MLAPTEGRLVRPLRVLHAPDVVGGQAVGLAMAENEIGLSSRCLTLRPSRFGYEPVEDYSSRGMATPSARLRLLKHCFSWADVIHFNFGQSCLPAGVSEPTKGGVQGVLQSLTYRAYSLVSLSDVYALRRAGKGIVVTFQGDDARTGKAVDTRSPLLREHGNPYGRTSDGVKIRRHARWERLAHAIFALNPDLLSVLPPTTRFLPYASVPVERLSQVPWRGPRCDGVLRVAHAPSHRGVKGTTYVQAAVDTLKQSGVPIELDIIEDEPQAEVLRRLRDCDVVVDQLLVGWYGALAVEAMALGKPVVCWLHADDRRRIPAGMNHDLPIIEASPSSLAQQLAALAATSSERLRSLSRKSQEFALAWHSPTRIAESLVPIYQDASRSRLDDWKAARASRP